MVQLLYPGRKTPVFPVTVKGIVPHRGGVLVLRTRRGRWDFPGGKIAVGETVEACLIRETSEEIGLTVRPMLLVDSWVRLRDDKPNTLVLVYLCADLEEVKPALGDEHVAWRIVATNAVAQLPMAARYRAAVARVLGDPPQVLAVSTVGRVRR